MKQARRGSFSGFLKLPFNEFMTAALQASKKALHILRKLLLPGPFAATLDQQKANNEVAISFPDANQFRKVLAQECAHASDTNSNFSILFLSFPNLSVLKKREVARFLFAITRRDKTLFLISENCFALFLRGLDAESGAASAIQISNLLHRYFADEFFSFQLLTYPEKIRSLVEFEIESYFAIH